MRKQKCPKFMVGDLVVVPQHRYCKHVCEDGHGIRDHGSSIGGCDGSVFEVIHYPHTTLAPAPAPSTSKRAPQLNLGTRYMIRSTYYDHLTGKMMSGVTGYAITERSLQLLFKVTDKHVFLGMCAHILSNAQQLRVSAGSFFLDSGTIRTRSQACTTKECIDRAVSYVFNDSYKLPIE